MLEGELVNRALEVMILAIQLLNVCPKQFVLLDERLGKWTGNMSLY